MKKLLLISLLATTQAYAEIGTVTRIVDCKTQYSRTCFKHWIDEDKDCLNTRHEILQAQSIIPVNIENCKVITGKWYDPYSGEYFTNPSDLDIDHIVPLKETWRSGGNEWSKKQGEQYANDFDVLIPVYKSLNRQKSDKDIAEWLPPHTKYLCEYLTRWVLIKSEYKLKADVSECETVKKSGCEINIVNLCKT